MDISEFEKAVLGSCTNDFEAPHTVAPDLARDMNRPVSISEVREAFLSLAAKGLVLAHIVDDSINEYVPISSAIAERREDAWFIVNAEGHRWYENEAG